MALDIVSVGKAKASILICLLDDCRLLFGTRQRDTGRLAVTVKMGYSGCESKSIIVRWYRG
jgi:hypothetical protein